MITHTSWSLGMLLGLPAFGLVALLALGALLLSIFVADDYDRPMFIGGSALTLIVTPGLAAAGFYPWHAEYHQWATTTGTVTDVSSRFIAGDKGNGSTQRFVVHLKGVGDRSCDDTRCANVKIGDTLTVTCKRHWQFAGTDGYDCNFVSLRKGVKA